MSALKRLQEVWPSGIPTSDYAAAVVMVIALAVGAKQQRERPASWRRPCSEEVRNRVRSVMAGRQLSVNDVANEARISIRHAYNALDSLAVRVGKKPSQVAGRKADLWALKSEAT